MKKISWQGGAAVFRVTTESRCTWAFCGGGPIFRDVAMEHIVETLESLLGWSHPAVQETRDYVRSLLGSPRMDAA